MTSGGGGKPGLAVSGHLGDDPSQNVGFFDEPEETGRADPGYDFGKRHIVRKIPLGRHLMLSDSHCGNLIC